jgi:hypothetical protein
MRPDVRSRQKIWKSAAPLICLLVSFWGFPAQGRGLHRVQIATGAASLQGAAISPDGSQVAMYFPNRLEIHDVSSLKVTASIGLPYVPEVRYMEGGEPESGVRYCDRGKYILIYGGGATFFVIDTLGYRRAATIALDIPKDEATEPSLIAGSCAAESNIAVIEVEAQIVISRGHYDSLRTIKVFNLDSGSQIGEIPLGSRYVSWRGVGVSPSGSHALIYLGNDDSSHPNIAILDIASSKLSASIDTGFSGGQATFVGESSVAVVGTFSTRDDAHGVIKIFDSQTGALKRETGDSNNAPNAAVEASADGRYLFAYTGKENHCEDCDLHSRGHLQIEHAQFTLWDLATGKIVVKSPGIPFDKGSDRVLIFFRDPIGRESTRPQFQFGQTGNAVLVTRMKWDAVNVYLLK